MAGFSPDMIPVLVAGALLIVALLYIVKLTNKINDKRRFAYLTEIVEECMDNHCTMVWIADPTGIVIPYVGAISTQNDALYELAEPGDASLAGSLRSRRPTNYTVITPQLAQLSVKTKLYRGPEIALFMLPFPFPANWQSTAAICQLAKEIRKHPRLGRFGNETEILMHLFNGTPTFMENLKTYISTVVYDELDSPGGGSLIPEEYLKNAISRSG
jgi:hypothetical protein